MKDLVIIGAGGFGRELVDHLQMMEKPGFKEGNLIGYVDENVTGDLILSGQISIYDTDASEGIFQNSNLRSIYIPVWSLSYLPDLTFANSKIETVTYEGTVEEWNAIGTGSDVFYGSTITEIICSDGVVPIDNRH